MTIRSLDSGSYEELTRLSSLVQRTYAEAFGSSMSPMDLAAHLDMRLGPDSFQGAQILVAGDFVGFAQIGAASYPEVGSGPGDGAIMRMYVLAEWQSQGVGSLLMKTALHELGDHLRVFLDVWAKNAGAIRFYERFGFRVVGERRLMLASGPAEDPDLIMVRDL